MLHLIIIGLTVLVSYRAFSDAGLKYKLIYSPYLAKQKGQGYRYITHALIHGDWTHLGVNMFVFYMFGSNVEQYFDFKFGLKGEFYFLLLYVGGVLFASLPALYKHKNDPYYNALGASGAVSAVVFSSIMISPFTSIYLFLAIPMPAIVFGVLYLAYEYWMDKRQRQDGVAHDAHFWGAVFGIVFTLAIQPDLAPRLYYQLLDILPF